MKVEEDEEKKVEGVKVEEEEEFDFDSLAAELGKAKPDEPKELDTGTPEFKKLAADFKEAMGIDLAEAMATFQDSAKQLAEAR